MNRMNCFINIAQGDMTYRFLPTGDIFTFTCDNALINQFRGNVKDGSVNNIYLRIYKESSVEFYPLLGIQSVSRVSASANALVYEGTIQGISYVISFRPVNNIWFWNIFLSGTDKDIDLVYGQDIGIGDEGAIYTNELYTSQYIGHSVYEGPNGYVICSRQNMPSPDSFPYMQQGVIGARAVHYSTDGLQFFGLSYKDTNEPEILKTDLPDYTLQYEFAYTALQTEKIRLNGEYRLSFYGIFMPTHPEPVSGIEYTGQLLKAYKETLRPAADLNDIPKVTVKKIFSNPYSSPAFTKDEINGLFPKRELEEYKDDMLFSFFTQEHAHIVTKAKEMISDRPNGTIIITPPDRDTVDNHLISTTQYMYGIFNSHVAVGNTNFHKFISTPRGFLNILKNSGQRIYICLEGKFRLLTEPALYEMGMNYSKWYYKLPDDILTITAYTVNEAPDIITEISSAEKKPYEYIITNQITMGENEYTNNISCTKIKDGIGFELNSSTYPGLHYDLTIPEVNYSFSDDRVFFENDTVFDETFLTISVKSSSDFKLIIKGYLSKEEALRQNTYSFEEEKSKVLSYYQSLTNNFHLESSEMSNERIKILNETALWYAHNAMIHYSMPHGLEQPGGAAWGTRDICQGPMEFFLATQNFKIIRPILLNIFAHQDFETKEWPQWFMFDCYRISAGDCHGDIIFWPLKSIADYILASGDHTILMEKLPYQGDTQNKETILQHMASAVEKIKQTRFIKNTGLITYAGGDWDDTLQPANEELKVKLISSWTTALAYQTFTLLSEALTDSHKEISEELHNLACIIKNSFERFLIKDGVIAGFMEYGEDRRYMLHPADFTTGIRYRLIPMTRSIISELVNKEQAKKNIVIIRKHLKFPDGVRLMDRPAHYDGGVSHLFRRAEQAANVGREISLQYTHAHIRYIEALAKIGEGREAWDSLFTINPILIQHSVSNANIRQSNMYFSSSDGAFHDRYDYEKDFEFLRNGEIEAKGGWRLYSSGPGIYFRQLVSNLLGIRFCKDGLIIDPVLPKNLDGLVFTYQCYGRILHFKYLISDHYTLRAVSQNVQIPFSNLMNPYRRGGILIKQNELMSCNDQITIYVKASD